jgi:hypothetical protein
MNRRSRRRSWLVGIKNQSIVSQASSWESNCSVLFHVESVLDLNEMPDSRSNSVYRSVCGGRRFWRLGDTTITTTSLTSTKDTVVPVPISSIVHYLLLEYSHKGTRKALRQSREKEKSICWNKNPTSSS